MKKILTIFLSLPIYLFAQSNTKLPLIERVIGDTISGKYNDIILKYDNFNRVKSIVNRNCFLAKTVSNPTNRLLIDTMQMQNFEYEGNHMQPYSRLVSTYEYDRVEYDNSNGNTEPLEYKAGRAELKLKWRDSVFHHYIYQNNQRVSDSVNNHISICCDENSKRVQKGEVRLKQTNTTFETEYFNIQTNDSREEIHYKDSIVHGRNIRNVLTYSQYEYYRNSLFCNYSKFDTAINPFHQLNISSCLKEGKISFEQIDLNNISNDFNLDDAIFQWYYLNENNPVAYEIKRGETDLPYKDKMLLSYTYNDFKLPVSCNVQIIKYFSNGEFAGKYHKRFTFGYKE